MHRSWTRGVTDTGYHDFPPIETSRTISFWKGWATTRVTFCKKIKCQKVGVLVSLVGGGMLHRVIFFFGRIVACRSLWSLSMSRPDEKGKISKVSAVLYSVYATHLTNRLLRIEAIVVTLRHVGIRRYLETKNCFQVSSLVHLLQEKSAR